MVSELKKRKPKKGDPAENDVVSKPVPEATGDTAEVPPTPLRYGPITTFSGQRLWSRSALILGLMAVVYFSSNSSIKESSFAKYEENIAGRAFETKCSSRFDSALKDFKGCRVSKCGRVLADYIEESSEFFLEDFSKRVFSQANGKSGIYDLFTGKLLHDKESDLVGNSGEQNQLFKSSDRQYFEFAVSAVNHMISQHFKVDTSKLRLNTAFYSQITFTGKRKSHMAQPVVHQDSFSSHFAAILYLTDFGKDFIGGRLIFPDSDSTNRTVEGRKGRVVAFTSGLENQHFIEPVTKGGLVTLTLGWTCDPKKQIGTIKLSSA